MDALAIKLNNVSKYYKLYDSARDRIKEALNPYGVKYHREFYALSDITVSVEKGEVLGVIGSNGSGKSTLLKLISNVLVPSSGTVDVCGRISALLELGAGFNPQFTGLENVYFYGTILGFSKDYMDAKIDDILAFADIGNFINQPLRTYSSGMRARLAFAVATEIDPDILIVDEVLAVGDTVFQHKCYSKINRMFQGGKTVILVSHNRSSIANLCSKAILLDKGKLICSGEAPDVIREYEKMSNKKFIGERGPTVASAGVLAGEDDNLVYENSNSEELVDELAWDPSLTASDPVYYNKSNIDFVDFGVYRLDGCKVNILKVGVEYKVKAYFVPGQDFDEEVTFGLRIRNIQGVVVSWVGFPAQKGQYLSLKKGKGLPVEFVIDCNLLDGSYVIDAGLQSFEESGLFVHVSINDLYLFKVEKDTSENVGGMVYLNSRACG